METSYKITYYHKSKPSEYDTAATIKEAREKAANKLLNDEECCANIVISEFEKETPNKTSVSMERYEMRDHVVTKLEY